MAQLGDYVWVDTNGNGQQDSGELGINGVTVDLYLSSDLTTIIATTTTANNPVGGAAGYYQFLNLDAGNYTVKFTLASGYIFTRQDTGADASDSDANRFTGFTGSYILGWAGTTQTVDAGIVLPASLGDYAGTTPTTMASKRAKPVRMALLYGCWTRPITPLITPTHPPSTIRMS